MMKDSLIKSVSFANAFAMIVLMLCATLGCTPPKEPTGPAEGSVQEYLDANPDVAARIDEDEADDEGDDGSGE